MVEKCWKCLGKRPVRTMAGRPACAGCAKKKDGDKR